MRWMVVSAAGLLLLAATAVGDDITLSSGETLHGRLLEQSERHIVFEHPVLGRLTLDRGQVTTVRTGEPTATATDVATPADGSDVPGQVEAAADTAAEPVRVAVSPAQTAVAVGGDPAGAAADEIPEHPSFFDGWNASVSLGFAGTEGNARSRSLNAGFKAQREDEQDRWLVRAAYFLNSNNGSRSRNEFKAELIKDWFVPETPWFYFASATYEYDEFQTWQQRASGFGGLGYTFVKREDFEFIGRLGFGATKELQGRRELRPEALVGASILRWNITPNQTLIASNTLYPRLDEGGQFRNVSSLEYSIRIHPQENLRLKFGIENEYDTHPDAADRRNDFKYFGALQFDF